MWKKHFKLKKKEDYCLSTTKDNKKTRDYSNTLVLAQNNTYKVLLHLASTAFKFYWESTQD